MKNSVKKLNKGIIAALLLFVLFTVYALWADKALTTRTFEITDKKIPSAFDGFRIAHVSDLHNATFGKGNEKLLRILEETNPDIIAVTGDIIDSRRTDISVAAAFLQEAIKIAPVYYVTGNHEARISNYVELEESIKRLGIKILENENLRLYRGDDDITLCGIKDPTFSAGFPDEERAVAARALEELREKSSFNLLLSHKPEYFDLYVQEGFDLVLSGHAHGGQFRLPFIGGLFAPGQGFFPEYDSGLYEENGTSMIVSRGLGNSVFPLRLFNRPEIITVVLKSN